MGENQQTLDEIVQIMEEEKRKNAPKPVLLDEANCTVESTHERVVKNSNGEEVVVDPTDKSTWHKIDWLNRTAYEDPPIYSANEFSELSYHEKQKIATEWDVHGTLPKDEMNRQLWDLIGDPDDNPPKLEGLFEPDPPIVTHGELNCKSHQELQSLASEHGIDGCHRMSTEKLRSQLWKVATEGESPYQSEDDSIEDLEQKTEEPPDSPKKFFHENAVDSLDHWHKQQEAAARGIEGVHHMPSDKLTRRLKEAVAREIKERREQLKQRSDTFSRYNPCSFCGSHYFRRHGSREGCADCGELC